MNTPLPRSGHSAVMTVDLLDVKLFCMFIFNFGTFQSQNINKKFQLLGFVHTITLCCEAICLCYKPVRVQIISSGTNLAEYSRIESGNGSIFCTLVAPILVS